MKWLSVNKFVPPDGNTVIQRVVNDGNIAYSEGKYDHKEKSWETFDDDYCFWVVTHFCIPDAIEIED